MSVVEDGEEVVLTIEAPADAESVLAEIVGAFGVGDGHAA